MNDKKELRPKFNFNNLYEIRDKLYERHASTLELPINEITLEEIETLNKTIQYLEKMSRDRKAEDYTYELIYSQILIEEVNKRGAWEELTTLHYSIISDCKWNDSVPTIASIEDLAIHLEIEIYDVEEMIKIHMTL